MTGWLSSPPCILDFDASVGKLADDEIRLPLQAWQERLRFSCSWSTLAAFARRVRLPEKHGCLFLGSGDYHHLSLLPLIKLAAAGQPFELLVLDNHPDNMRYPFGLHCGSWIYHASKLPCISHIHVLGITAKDISLSHAWENHLTPFLNKKLTYWSIGQSAGWLKVLGRGEYSKVFATPDALLTFFSNFPFSLTKMGKNRKIYLSLDKDVFAPSLVKSNWDQGVFTTKHLQKVLQLCAHNLIGMDITGEVSVYQYKSASKKFFSALDQQKKIDNAELKKWQQEQLNFNLSILDLLKAALN